MKVQKTVEVQKNEDKPKREVVYKNTHLIYHIIDLINTKLNKPEDIVGRMIIRNALEDWYKHQRRMLLSSSPQRLNKVRKDKI